MAGQFKLDSKGVQQMLKDMTPDLARRANAIAKAAGAGHGAEAVAGRKRALAAVWTTTFEAARREVDSGSLSSAIDAGGGSN